ncbi:MAG TPA: NAD(P)H-binding protein [Streptosporangiaceae bacterium]
MIVVTGATGNVGRPLTASLVSAGHVVTAVARGTSAGLPDGPGIIPVAADLTASQAAQSLAVSIAGAEALFLLVPGSGAGVDAAALLETARTAGVQRVVLLSSQAVGSRPGAVAYASMAAIEAAVTRSGLEWTILRAGGLAANAFAWAPAVRARQTVFAPYGDVALPAIDPLDLAEVAAAALTGHGHLGQTYVLTGPEATTPRQRTQSIATAIRQQLAFMEISPHDARDQMLQFMPAPVADATLAILGHPTPEEAQVSPGVEKILGRPGRSFADWAQRNAIAFR